MMRRRDWCTSPGAVLLGGRDSAAGGYIHKAAGTADRVGTGSSGRQVGSGQMHFTAENSPVATAVLAQSPKDSSLAQRNLG
jgi:hypothetical protein